MDRAHREHAKSFIDVGHEIARREGWREYDVFVKWLEASTAALMNPVLTGLGRQEEWAKNEARYMHVVHSCKHPKTTMSDFSRMLSFCTLALEEKPTDFIGPVFMELAANENVGQFFTPGPLAAVSARMALGNVWDILTSAYAEEGRTHITLSEPACGVGAMVLEANSVLKEHNVCPARDAHWVVTDIDWKAVCGAYIQLSLTGCSAVVVHGDTLKLEEWGKLPTIAAVLHPK